MAGHGGGDNGVWQGYVAVIASLAQAMLFLMAILVIALMQVSSQIDLSKSPGRRALLDESLSLSAQQRGGSWQSKKVAIAKAKSESESGLTNVDYVLIFANETSVLGQADKAKLSKAISERGASATKGQWKIYASVDEADSLSKRMGYRRIIEVRNFLVSQGVQNERIALELGSLLRGFSALPQNGAVYLIHQSLVDGRLP